MKETQIRSAKIAGLRVTVTLAPNDLQLLSSLPGCHADPSSSQTYREIFAATAISRGLEAMSRRSAELSGHLVFPIHFTVIDNPAALPLEAAREVQKRAKRTRKAHAHQPAKEVAA